MIGIGMMGHGIATNLLKHGHALTLLEHPGNQSLAGLIASGADTVSDPKSLAMTSDIIILCVTGTPQVEEVLLGDNGVLMVCDPMRSLLIVPPPFPPQRLVSLRWLSQKAENF